MYTAELLKNSEYILVHIRLVSIKEESLFHKQIFFRYYLTFLKITMKIKTVIPPPALWILRSSMDVNRCNFFSMQKNSMAHFWVVYNFMSDAILQDCLSVAKKYCQWAEGSISTAISLTCISDQHTSQLNCKHYFTINHSLILIITRT